MKPTLTVLFALVLLAGPSAGRPEEKAPFGFSSMEIVKTGWGCFGLRTARIDADDCDDIVFVNNAKARIDIFLARPDGFAAEDSVGEENANKLPKDKYFEKKELLTEKDVTALELADVDGDGHVDIVYYGKPPELVVAYGDGKAGFTRTKTFDVEKGSESSSALAVGDLSGDGRPDLAFLTKDKTLLYYQSEKGEIGEPVRVPHGTKGVGAVDIKDLNGDGLMDLIHYAGNDPRPLRVRFQEPGGALGPEYALKVAPFRTLGFEELTSQPGSELLAVQRKSGLLRLMRVTSDGTSSGTSDLGTIQLHPFAEAGGSKAREMAIGDVSGDGRLDVLVTEPGTAQVALHRQMERGTIGPRQLFPSLSEADTLLAVAFKKGAPASVLTLSAKEKTAGVAALDKEGRLSYPTALPVKGEPKAMASADVTGNGTPDVVVVAKHEEKWMAFILSPAAGGTLALAGEFELENMSVKRDEPGDILLTDLDQDGRTDLLVFDRYKTMRTYRQKDDGSFEDVSAGPDYGGGLVEKKRKSDTALIDLDGDGKHEFLVASKNFARALVLVDGRLTVKDQVNARSSSSQIKALAGIDLTGDGQAEVALLDSDGNMLTVLQRDESGVYQVSANIPVGTFTFAGLFAADLNGDGRDDLAILGRARFGVLIAGGADYQIKELHSFESPIEEAWLNDYAIGDLNNDGRPDIAVTEARKNTIEIVSLDEEKGFKHEIQWRVFDEKIHGGTGRGGSQPYDIATGDVNGDGRTDLVVFVHDRLVVYMQDE